MNSKKKSLDNLWLFKFGVTTFFLVDFIRRTFLSAFALDSVGMVISIGIVSFFALIGFKNEFHNIQLHSKARADQLSVGERIKIILSFTFVSIATYLIAILFDINVTFAASMIVLLMVFLIPEPFPSFQATVYTGSFVGMVGNQFISSWPLALLFAFVGSLLFLFFQPSFHATGGRAGLNAYMTSFLFIFLFPSVKTGVGAPLDKNVVFLSFFFILAGAFIPHLLKEKKLLSGVESAMLITLILNLIIPNEWSVLINAGFLGSFMGTTGSDRIKSLPFLFLVEFFGFLLFVPAYPLLAGMSGKLGVITLVGYLAADGFTSSIKYIKI